MKERYDNEGSQVESITQELSTLEGLEGTQLLIASLSQEVEKECAGVDWENLSPTSQELYQAFREQLIVVKDLLREQKELVTANIPELDAYSEQIVGPINQLMDIKADFLESVEEDTFNAGEPYSEAVTSDHESSRLESAISNPRLDTYTIEGLEDIGNLINDIQEEIDERTKGQSKKFSSTLTSSCLSLREQYSSIFIKIGQQRNLLRSDDSAVVKNGQELFELVVSYLSKKESFFIDMKKETGEEIEDLPHLTLSMNNRTSRVLPVTEHEEAGLPDSKLTENPEYLSSDGYFDLPQVPISQEVERIPDIADIDASTIEGINEMYARLGESRAIISELYIEKGYETFSLELKQFGQSITDRCNKFIVLLYEQENRIRKGDEDPKMYSVELYDNFTSFFNLRDKFIEAIKKEMNSEAEVETNKNEEPFSPTEEGEQPIPEEVVRPEHIHGTDRFGSPEAVKEMVEKRKRWKTAMHEHKAAHAQYQAAAAGHYESLGKQSFVNKNWSRLKASLGFKPQLPKEIQAQRAAMFDATAKYNSVAREMLNDRSKAGKSIETGKREAIMARYNRMLARTTLLNTFNSQLDLQNEATQNLAFGQSEFLKKHGKSVGLLGAVALGAASGGIVGGGFAVVRVLAGGAAAGITTKFVGDKMDSFTQKKSKEWYKNEVDEIEAMLARRVVSAQDLEDCYFRLSDIYEQVDSLMRTRIVAIMGTAVLTGMAVGGASGFVMEATGFGADAPTTADTNDATPVPKAPVPEQNLDQNPPQPQDVPAKNIPTLGGSNPVVPEGSGASPAGVGTEAVPSVSPDTNISTAEKPTYTAQKGDNFWDIMEGQTEAKAFEHVAEGDKQKLIALVAEKINQDATLRGEIGFGSTADVLREGGAVDIEKLHEITELVAKENNLYVEAPNATTPSVETGAASTPGVTAVETTPTPAATATEGTTNAVAAAEIQSPSQTEAVAQKPITNVSFEQINDYARGYPDGVVEAGKYMKFEQDFQTKWVEKIQGPPVGGGLLGLLIGNPNTVDAFKTFGFFPVADFNKLATLPPAELAQYLSVFGIDVKDYEAWKTALADWQKQGLVIKPTDSFEDVAKAAFIKSLLETPKP